VAVTCAAAREIAEQELRIPIMRLPYLTAKQLAPFEWSKSSVYSRRSESPTLRLRYNQGLLTTENSL